jgi:DNA-binding SARP family transcriptional activator
MGAVLGSSVAGGRGADPGVHGPGQGELRLLGTFAFRQAQRLMLLPPSGQRVIAYLALHGPVSRSQAAGALWPDTRQANAFGDLRTVLWRLRRYEVSAVRRAGPTVWLDESVRVDYWLFERWARTILGSPASAGPILPPDIPLGPLVPDWDEDWLTGPREAARILGIQALEVLAERLLATCQPAAALPYLLPVTQLEPLRESAVRLMVQACLRLGNVTDALIWYRRYRRRLRMELSLDPSPALTSLVARHAPPGWSPRGR